MKKTISIRIGKGSISHNNRKFVAKNVDEKRVKDNVVLCREELKDVYDDIFGAALAEYNAKQKRKDRRIMNYLDHITNGKQEKPFYELVFQIGKKMIHLATLPMRRSQRILCVSIMMIF